jgi:hypothetical protein
MAAWQFRASDARNHPHDAFDAARRIERGQLWLFLHGGVELDGGYAQRSRVFHFGFLVAGWTQLAGGHELNRLPDMHGQLSGVPGHQWWPEQF